MDSSGFYDEGLVAAASGLPAETNPYPKGTGFHENWRRGFTSYGAKRDDEATSEDPVRKRAYPQYNNASLTLCPWTWCLIHGAAA